jgi:hypothetical protein
VARRRDRRRPRRSQSSPWPPWLAAMVLVIIMSGQAGPVLQEPPDTRCASTSHRMPDGK